MTHIFNHLDFFQKTTVNLHFQKMILPSLAIFLFCFLRALTQKLRIVTNTATARLQVKEDMLLYVSSTTNNPLEVKTTSN